MIKFVKFFWRRWGGAVAAVATQVLITDASANFLHITMASANSVTMTIASTNNLVTTRWPKE